LACGVADDLLYALSLYENVIPGYSPVLLYAMILGLVVVIRPQGFEEEQSPDFLYI
jgi:hypothetical protein